MSWPVIFRSTAVEYAKENKVTLIEAKEALSDKMRIAPLKGFHLVWDKDGFYLGTEKDGIQNPLWEKIRR